MAPVNFCSSTSRLWNRRPYISWPYTPRPRNLFAFLLLRCSRPGCEILSPNLITSIGSHCTQPRKLSIPRPRVWFLPPYYAHITRVYSFVSSRTYPDLPCQKRQASRRPARQPQLFLFDWHPISNLGRPLINLLRCSFFYSSRKIACRILLSRLVLS